MWALDWGWIKQTLHSRRSPEETEVSLFLSLSRFLRALKMPKKLELCLSGPRIQFSNILNTWIFGSKSLTYFKIILHFSKMTLPKLLKVFPRAIELSSWVGNVWILEGPINGHVVNQKNKNKSITTYGSCCLCAKMTKFWALLFLLISQDLAFSRAIQNSIDPEIHIMNLLLCGGRAWVGNQFSKYLNSCMLPKMAGD